MHDILDKSSINWKFSKKNDGSFFVEDASNLPILYFPLMNTVGMKSFVTPDLKGDVCKDFHHYLTTPTVTEEIHRTLSSRNFWIKGENQTPWSATGQSAFQKTHNWNDLKDQSSIKASIGSFTTIRKQHETSLEAEITTFIPEGKDFVEILSITVTNRGTSSQNFDPYYALPLFGRSADNARDHRQVTTMFQENFLEEYGVRVKPKIVHDEVGHKINKTNYVSLAFGNNAEKPEQIWIRLHDFIGESGSLDNPEAIYRNLIPPKLSESEMNGKEAIAAFKFKKVALKPGEKAEYIIIHGITDDINDLDSWKDKYDKVEKVDQVLKKTLKFWKEKLNSVEITTGNNHFDNWVKWIEYQVKCRQIFGNSFLPDYSYGRGGRGWRDLWQDLLSIFLVDPISGHEEIVNCFKGIRVDGSNATIIGEKAGEFKADRNNIPRTWSDHGAWPVFVLNFYLNQTGDFSILDKEITYWKDKFVERSKKIDDKWQVSQGHFQRQSNGATYAASILEHLIIQQLTSFYNVNNKNVLLLEGADWNDTYDMARENGGSVCFYNFYANNLSVLCSILKEIKKKGSTHITLLEEMAMLLDNLPGQQKVNYNSPEAKRAHLKNYFESIEHTVSGKKTSLLIDEVVTDLEAKSLHISNHILKNEIVLTKDGDRFFNGHYDNIENRLGGEKKDGIMMDLTSQVIPIICNISNKEMSAEVYESIKKILKDEGSPGIRLTSEFKNIDLNVGRITGFVYGQKEHGSKWIQQNIMLAYGLYKQNLVTQGNEIMQEVYTIANNTQTAKIFPGIPSYFDNQNRGAYAYLTGSSSWFLLTLITQIYGIKGKYGALFIEPKLSTDYFNEEGVSEISTIFSGRNINVVFINKNRLDYDSYLIKEVSINHVKIDLPEENSKNSIELKDFNEILNQTNNSIKVILE